MSCLFLVCFKIETGDYLDYSGDTRDTGSIHISRMANISGEWWLMTIPIDDMLNESKIKEQFPISEFQEWFMQSEVGQNGSTQYRILV